MAYYNYVLNEVMSQGKGWDYKNNKSNNAVDAEEMGWTTFSKIKWSDFFKREKIKKLVDKQTIKNFVRNNCVEERHHVGRNKRLVAYYKPIDDIIEDLIDDGTALGLPEVQGELIPQLIRSGGVLMPSYVYKC